MLTTGFAPRIGPAPSGLAPVGGAGTARARIQEAKMTARSNRKTSTKPSTTAAKARATARTMKPPTKRARLIGLLKAAGGADTATLSAALGWQQHSTRAALTGLRKTGFSIERTTPDGARAATYRITAEPKEVLAQGMTEPAKRARSRERSPASMSWAARA